MENSVFAGRSASLNDIRYLSSLLEGDASFEQQVDAYLETRQALAEYFRLRALEELTDAGPSTAELKTRIASFLESRLAGRAPSRVLEVRGYSGVHQVLLRYLHRHVGSFVSGDRLRVLTGDQVHTERRVRELRDLGLNIEAKKVAGQNQYRLASAEPDLLEASRYHLRKNLEADGGYSQASIALLLSELR